MTTLNTSRSASGAGTTSRWTIALLLFIIYLINFADRGVLGAVAPTLIREFHLSIRQFGIVGSAFGWGYTTIALCSAVIIARLGAKRTYIYFVLLWSLFIVLLPFGGGFLGLVILRALFGACEGVSAPAAGQLLGTWFPAEERAKAVMVMPLALPLSTLIITPVAIPLAAAYGWQFPFIALGILGPIWVLYFRKYASDKPSIATQITNVNTDSPLTRPSPVTWTRIVRSRPLWISSFAVFSSAYFNTFLMNFLPLYFVREKHIKMSSVAYMGTVPWIAMALGAAVSGWLSDYAYKKTQNLRLSRSYLAGGCLLLCGAGIAASLLASSIFSVVCLISVASFINSLSGPALYAMPIDLFPDHSGTAMSLFTVIGTLGFILAPLLTGLVVDATGKFYFAFALTSGISVAGGALLISLWRPHEL